MAIYGYARVSTQKQKLLRQIQNIHAVYPGIRIFTDKYTGTKLTRPQFQLLLQLVRPSDTLVFDSVSRMSRNSAEGFELYMSLYSQGVNLVFLNEPHISTEHFKQASKQSIDKVGDSIADIYIEATNRVLMILAQKQIQLAFEQSEKEAADTRQRIRDGLRVREVKTGQKNGRKTGDKLIIKKKSESIRIIKKHSKSFYGSLNDADVMKLLNICRNTYYKYKKEAQKQFDSERISGVNPFRIKLKQT